MKGVISHSFIKYLIKKSVTMNLNKLYTLGLFLSTLFIFSCGQETVVTVDNPTNKPIHVIFENGYELNLEPYKSKRLTFDNLKSSVKFNGGEAETFELEKGKEYILNPSKETYYLEAFEYGTSMNVSLSGQDKSKKGIPLNFASEGEQMVMGYFKEMNDLLIEKKWDWGLTKTVPKQIEVRNYGSTIRTKVFRKSMFLSFHKRQGM